MQLKKNSVASSSSIFYALRREPLYHKLQYSKVPKFDVAAAILGVIVGAFVVYLSLCTVGSAGADLSDLTVLAWYVIVWVNILYFYFLRLRVSSNLYGGYLAPLLWLKEMTLSFFFYLKFNFFKKK